MYKIEIKLGKDTPVAMKTGVVQAIPFDSTARQHKINLIGVIRNPDGSKRRRKTAASNMPITIITEN
ncbi:MAG: hypothetical protein IAE90_07330 [Ignavibacteria bacterium]|nr:hypothetical protein [Ignavibacteria bacterium]